MAGKDSKKRVNLLFHHVAEHELRPGDRIYAYRAARLYAHHRIYIGEPGVTVGHFVGEELQRNAGIQSSTLEDSYSLFVRLAAYDANLLTPFFMRSLTAHQCKSRPAEEREWTPTAKTAEKDDSKKRAGLLFQMVRKNELRPGDHIYAYRYGGIYAHHGIYIGEPGMEVIHFSGNKCEGNPYIQSCTYEEFKGHALFVRLVAYDVNPLTTFFKRAQTTHPYKSKPAKEVIETAQYYLKNPQSYDDYHFYFNNCESFAIYCKTGRELPSSQLTPFSSVVDSAIALVEELDDEKKLLPQLTLY